MSTNTRITRSKGKSDGLSLPAMLRPWRKPSNMENDDGDTILNTTFNAGSSQHHPQMPIHTSPLRCQSMPPQTSAIRMQEIPLPAVPAAAQKPTTSHIPLPTSPNSGSHLSQLSPPLFTKDRCSSTSEEELEVDAEVTLINRKNKPNRTFTHNSTTGRPTSTLKPMDYTTQGDPNQVAPSTPLMFMSTTTKTNFLALIIFSFQMVVTGVYMISVIKFSTQVTWRMATTHIS